MSEELRNISTEVIKLHDNKKLMRMASLVGTDSKTPELKLSIYIQALIKKEVLKARRGLIDYDGKYDNLTKYQLGCLLDYHKTAVKQLQNQIGDKR